jgi:hypothetical protein
VLNDRMWNAQKYRQCTVRAGIAYGDQYLEVFPALTSMGITNRNLEGCRALVEPSGINVIGTLYIRSVPVITKLSGVIVAGGAGPVDQTG